MSQNYQTCQSNCITKVILTASTFEDDFNDPQKAREIKENISNGYLYIVPEKGLNLKLTSFRRSMDYFFRTIDFDVYFILKKPVNVKYEVEVYDDSCVCSVNPFNWFKKKEKKYKTGVSRRAYITVKDVPRIIYIFKNDLNYTL